MLRRLLGGALDLLAATWPALAAGILATSLNHGIRPITWRRPVRREFARALHATTLGTLPAVVIAAAVVGVGVIAQALYWLQSFGETDTVRSTLRLVLIREVAPLAVGLVMLGRNGLVELAELRRLRADGSLRVLEAQGIDPSLFLALPRVLAFGAATFCHAIVFAFVAVAIGYVAGALVGLNVGSPVSFAFAMARDIGAVGVIVLPIKGILLGLVLGAVVVATALAPWDGDPRLQVPQGFFRGLIALVVLSGTVSLLL